MNSKVLFFNYKFVNAVLLPIILLTVIAVQAEPAAKSGDYEPRPILEVDYTQLELHLEVGFSSRVIRGNAAYNFRPKHAYVDQISWQAREMDIESVSMNGQDIPIRFDDNILSIDFDEYLSENAIYEIRVIYSAEPTFGVHFKPNSTVFSSNMPGSVSHWLPGPVHPRASMPVRFEMEVPEALKAVSSGDLANQESSSRGSRFIRVTDQPVPISELGFAAGLFEFTETFSGTKSLGIYHESDTISEDERQELLEHLVRRTNQMERFLRSELPVNSFHAVVLDDDRWETRPYAAGMTYLFRNQNQIEVQLDRSLSAQWFGVSLRSEQWQDLPFTILLQAAIAEEINISDWKPFEDPVRRAFQVPETVYNYASLGHWQWARTYIRNNQNPVMASVIRASLQELTRRNTTWSNRDFSDFLYDKTGRWMELPDLRQPVPESEYRYRVRIEQVRGSDNFTLEFIPEADIIDDQFPVTVYWIRDGRIHEAEKHFHGSGETLEADPGGHISNIWIGRSENESLDFMEEKSFSFWLFQLRRDDNAYRRKKAAEALRNFAEDPDLQLALQDRVNREEDTAVQTALYSTLADITAGASGTERRFLEGIHSNHSEIRLVSMEALKAYGNNQRVKDEVLGIIQTSDDITLVNYAIQTYRHLLDEENYRTFVLQFLREDRQDLLFTKTLLQELFELPPDDAAVEMAAEYLRDGYSFDLRWLAYRLLRTHVQNSDWQKDFVNSFSRDPDPRIRFLTLFSLTTLDSEEHRLFLEERMLYEYDIRILKRIKEMSTAE